MNRSCYRVAGILQAGVALTLPAIAQSLLAPERMLQERQLFAGSASAAILRCELNPVHPVLTYGFRFQTGYKLGVPLDQFRGSGHALTVHARVTPEGREPLYLIKSEMLPEVRETKVEAATGGTFVVGEGTYGLSVLVEDDLHRFCRGEWQIQVRRTGSERHLIPMSPPGAVEELAAGGPPPAAAKSGPSIARLTILVHAAPLSPSLSALAPEDIERLVDSLCSLLRELPAQRVRLIAFNLDQRAIVFRKDGFENNHAGELSSALRHLELGLADYRILRERPEPMDLLLGLVQAELRDPQPPDALIVLGPPTRMRDDVPADAPGQRPAAAPPIFHLQFQLLKPTRPNLRTPTPVISRAPSRAPDPLANADGTTPPHPAPLQPVDSIDRLVNRLKGRTIPIRTPHDLADAIQRMIPRIHRTAAP